MSMDVSVLNSELSYAELIKQVDSLEAGRPDSMKTMKVGVSANITADSAKYFYKKHALLNDTYCEVVFGDYDSHAVNFSNFVEQNVDVIVVNSLFDNLGPALESSVGHWEQGQIEALVSKVVSELELCLGAASDIKHIFVDRFYPFLKMEAIEQSPTTFMLLERLNDELDLLEKKYPNLRVFDSEQIVKRVGEKSLDQRFYYRYKSPYTNAYWNEYCRELLLATRFSQSYFYKVIVLDCDNTLWGGIIGEDLMEGIKLDPFDYPGNIYWRVQNELLDMQKQGILLCLCSKNNPEDVDEVLEKHSSMVIRNENVLLKKVNWTNKVQNIKELSEDLNLGLDSFIFIDDSDFEVQSVREMLPAVTTLQVPKKIHEYPNLIKEVRALVVNGGLSEANRKKTEQYKIRAKSIEERGRHSSFEDYLKALDLEVTVRRSEIEKSKRIAELTQKSNQFNLTTRRYTEPEILAMMNGDDFEVYSIHVRDKFGDSGLTGVAIVDLRNNEPQVDSFLMSCRVIGRTIEYSLWHPIIDALGGKGFQRLFASYIPTLKNKQVSDFYEKMGFEKVEELEGGVKYVGEVDKLMDKNRPKYIKVSYDI